MTLKIFNSYNGFVEVDVGQKEIDFIVVTVVQGCEIIQIYFKDGTSVEVDQRIVSVGMPMTLLFYDGTYVVTPDKLKEWIDIGDSSDRPAFYRLETFCELYNFNNLSETINDVKIAYFVHKNGLK